MGHSHGPEDILTGIKPYQCSMNHNGSGYSNHILDFIICYPILTVTSHYTVPDSLALAMQISSKRLGSVDTIICGLALHWNYCTHGLLLKLDLRHDSLFWCEWNLMIHTDIDRGCITKDSDLIVDLRGDLDTLSPNTLPGILDSYWLEKLIFSDSNWFLF